MLPSASAIKAPTCGLGVGSPPTPSSKARDINSLSRSFTRSLTVLGSHELVHLDHELVDVAERAVDTGEAHVSHVIERLQTLHHAFADDQRWNFLFATLGELALQGFCMLLEGIGRDRAFVAGNAQTAQHLFALEGHPFAVLLHDGGQRVLDAFVGREATLAAVALPPTPSDRTARSQARIDHPAIHFSAIRALHRIFTRADPWRLPSTFERRKNQRYVSAAKAEGVGHGALDAPFPGVVGHEFEGNFQVWVIEVDGRRDHSR